MVEYKDVELTSPHKHIKNAFPCGAILIENLLKTGRKTLAEPRV